MNTFIFHFDKAIFLRILIRVCTAIVIIDDKKPTLFTYNCKKIFIYFKATLFSSKSLWEHFVNMVIIFSSVLVEYIAVIFWFDMLPTASKKRLQVSICLLNRKKELIIWKLHSNFRKNTWFFKAFSKTDRGANSDVSYWK